MKAIVIGAHLLRDDIEPVAAAVGVGDLYLSTLEVPDDQPLGDRELLVKVAGLRGRLLDVATFVAIRYGFALSTPDDALAKCAPHLARWKRILTAHREHVEMTLKVVASSTLSRPDRHDFTSGAGYLRALHAARQAADVDPQFREAAERVLVPLAVRNHWQHRDEKSVELALLVPRDRLDDVKAAGEELRRTNPEIPFLLSGPWPLEVFADADRE
ncbi:MAG TPA: GvpL/GvpF family gas vesicle protein [Thermoanaerobaculia bacterium]|nr:GvpL/GvpF family gas vesicle protein [Thermoanaerobaculia bacterium]